MTYWGQIPIDSRLLAAHGGLVRRSPQRSCDVRYAGRPTMFAKLKWLDWLAKLLKAIFRKPRHLAPKHHFRIIGI